MDALRTKFGHMPRMFTPSLTHACRCRPQVRVRSEWTRSIDCTAINARRRVSSSAVLRSPRLRFAPSPTGSLHLGGLRTALLNHLYARSTGGKWILRIEDTDQSRLVPGSREALLENLAWAGLDFDEGPGKGGSHGPYVQSERLDIYRDYAHRLIDSGHAYYDFRKPEERSALDATPGGRRRSQTTYQPPAEDRARDMIRDGESYSVRLKFEPQAIQHTDVVFGRMTFPADYDAEDPVLLKQDGWPTYHLASVVDDHLMEISHVFRGEEWLPSLPKHLVLYKALALEPPQFAHLPLLMNQDGSKLSKRSGHASLEDYRKQGYEPEALLNFIALMGYNHQHEATEINEGESERDFMSMDHLIASFDLDRISQSRAALNLSKLQYLNRLHLRSKMESKMSNPAAHSALLQRLRRALEAKYDASGLGDERVEQIAHLISERANTLPEMVDGASMLFCRPDWSSEAAIKLRKSLTDALYREAIQCTIDALNDPSVPEDAQAAEIASVFDQIMVVLNAKISRAEAGKIKGKGKLMKPLRQALTGENAGPTVPDIISVLGKEATLARLQEALRHDASSASV